MINQEKIDIVIEYIKKLDNYLQSNLNDEDEIFDLIFEVCSVMEKEIPDIADSLLLRNNTTIKDTKVLLGKLKWYLANNGVALNAVNLGINTILKKLWVALRYWLENEAVKFLKDDYLIYDDWNGGSYIVNIDYPHEYKLRRGMELPAFFNNDCPNIEDIKLFIELAYSCWIKDDRETHYKFTIDVNQYLQIFKLPYKLQNGLFIKLGYKTSFVVEEIVDYKMFERKIKFSEDMIMSKDLLEKKCALDFIIDALQYFVSSATGENKEKKKQYVASTVNSDTNSKVYSVIKNELEELFKISNDYFDIRHNEYLNGQKQRREALNDSQFIEYLYNRAYALLYLIRLKRQTLTVMTGQNN